MSRSAMGSAASAGVFDALVETHQMRRRVDVNAAAGSLEKGLQKRGHRTLSVGARNVDHGRQLGLRAAELGQQALNTSQRQIDKLRVQKLHLSEKRVARRAFGRNCHESA